MASPSADILPGSRSSISSVTQIWPNPIPLECGIIRTLDKQGPRDQDTPRFPTNHLRKMLVYARGKGTVAYPNFRFSIWSHIATNKMDMSEEMAWLYFETFDMVSEITAKDRLELLKLISKCSSPEELGELRKKLSVDTMQFILFLYLQNSPRYSLKTPMVSGEQWPSPESELRQRSWEQYHLMFLRAKLLEMLELLQDSEEQLSEEAVKALGFVFSAAVHSKPCSLLEVAVSAHTQTGYSKISKTFSLTQFEFWMRSLLVINPFGPLSLMSHRRELKPVSYFCSDGNDRILSNGATTPALHSMLGCTLLYRVSKQTVAVSEESIGENRIHIKNCQRSNIYLLAPLRSVLIEKCSRCVLVLGAVSSAVVINNSDRLTIITACRRIHVSSSSTCVFHLLTMTKPLLLPGSVHITLAPYNTHYPILQKHIQKCGLYPSINHWNSPINLTGVGGISDSSVWAVMPPEVFHPIEVPFDLPGETEEIPYPLPPQYLHMLAIKKERTRQWYDLLKQLHLTKEQGKQLWSTVKDHFEEWLTSEGHKKELLDLGGHHKSSPSLTVNIQVDGQARTVGCSPN